MLKVIQTSAEEIQRRSPLHASGEQALGFADGFHGEEWEGVEPFRWMGDRGSLVCDPSAKPGRFAELAVFSQFFDLSQELTLTAGRQVDRFPLLQGWSSLSVPVAEGTRRLDLEVNRLFPPDHHPGDPRELAIRVRWPRLHDDSRRHASTMRQYDNAVLNTREMLEHATVLASTPPQLGIDMYGECNIKPACVYCAWDENKAEEGKNVDTPFTRETLDEWAEFFDNSRNLVNCSIGEPFMMKNFDELLDIFGAHGKVVEITTNGQILTDRNIEKLLGRNIDLYISLDAATAETFAKLRNRHFQPILDNLRRLVGAKGGPGRLPRVSLVFMPMRVNVHELEEFVALCADLEVDRMILRPLNWMEKSDLNFDRAGYRFNYLEELLPFEELVRISGRAAELAATHGVEISDQLDFGGATLQTLFEEGFARGREEATRSSESAPGAVAPTVATPSRAEPTSLGNERLPICTEPWKSLYILRRGTLPCCHGSPLAEMDEYRETWNSPILQAIRRSLSEGHFHPYCLDASSCPIVRKAAQANAVRPSERLLLRFRTLWHKVNGAFGGLPGQLLRPLGKRWKRSRRV